MSLAPSDLGTLVRRWPYCVVCLVLIVGSVAGWWFLRDRIAELQVAHAQRTKEGEAMLALLVGGSTQRAELEAVREATRRIDENLVVEANLAENLWYFYKLEEQTKARLPELHQLSSPTNDKSPLYRRVPYSLRIAGGYDQVAAFLLALETGPRLVKITSFNYARADPSGSAIALDLNVELLGRK
jgi:Tfp pilus assembly protein PilO